MESAAGGTKQQQQAGRGLLLIPHAELDVVVTPEGEEREGRREREREAARLPSPEGGMGEREILGRRRCG